MPDITMCNNNECKMAPTCYRFNAEPDMVQSYALFVYDSVCEYYIPMAIDKLGKRAK